MKWVWIWKPLASAGFVFFALQEGAWLSVYGRVILAALVLSWFGDVFLIPESSTCFLLGLLFFLLAHVAFAAAFLIRGVQPAWTLGAACAVLILAVWIGRWLLPPIRRSSPGMRIPVLVYMAAISVMVSLAAGAAGFSHNFVILAGAIAFFVSDISVARDQFVAPGMINKLWGLPLYYAAQFLLAATVRFPR